MEADDLQSNVLWADREKNTVISINERYEKINKKQ